jgi:hypothetical protein
MRQFTRTLIMAVIAIAIVLTTVGFAFPSHIDSVVVNGSTYSRTINEFHPWFLLCLLGFIPLFVWYTITYNID